MPKKNSSPAREKTSAIGIKLNAGKHKFDCVIGISDWKTKQNRDFSPLPEWQNRKTLSMNENVLRMKKIKSIFYLLKKKKKKECLKVFVYVYYACLLVIKKKKRKKEREIECYWSGGPLKFIFSWSVTFFCGPGPTDHR